MSLPEKNKQEVQAALDGVEKGGVAGAVFVAIDKKGQYLVQAASGYEALDHKKKLDDDSVFWIASCTKQIVGIAAMQLVEQGKLDLDSHEKLYEICPELKEKQVLQEDGSLVPRQGEITLRMLLAHTAGFGYSFFNERLDRYGRPTTWDEFSGDAEDLLDQPLVNQPGSRWEYGVNIDWAGLAVERASGLTLDEYFKKHIFEPCGITDVTFRPTQHMREHLVHLIQRFPDGKTVNSDQPLRRAIFHAEGKKANNIFHSGGAGCFAKPKEYVKLIAMYLNNGTSPNTGKQVLKPESVDEMFKNQIPEFPNFSRQAIPAARPWLTNALPEIFPQEGNPPQGWGLTFHITQEPCPWGRAKNTVWWAGIANLFWWCDRENGVGGMIASQILPFGDPNVMGAWIGCETAVYSGIKNEKTLEVR